MAEFFSSKLTEKNKQKNLQTKYNSSISNLLLVVAFSVVNIVLLLVNADSYFLFSAFIPYFAVDYGMYFCGLYPEEYYADVPDMEFSDKSFLAVMIAVAAVILLIYVLCWYFAKKKKIVAVLIALIFFMVDTAAMFVLSGFSVDSAFDILIHIWVISYLIIAIVTYNKMKNTPLNEVEKEFCAEDSEESDNEEQFNSSVLRMAEDVRCRVLIETEYSGMHIVFRRVKRTNELVVNGCVYDEYVAFAEFAHTLTGYVNGHKIEANYDGAKSVRIFVDSCEVAKKLRLI